MKRDSSKLLPPSSYKALASTYKSKQFKNLEGCSLKIQLRTSNTVDQQWWNKSIWKLCWDTWHLNISNLSSVTKMLSHHDPNVSRWWNIIIRGKYRKGYLQTKELMKQTPSWEVNSQSAGQEISFNGTQRHIIIVMGPQHNPILSQLSHLHLCILLLKSALTVLPIMLKSHKWYICFKDLTEFCMHFSFPSCMLDIPTSFEV
jgi:hypothetical protein